MTKKPPVTPENDPRDPDRPGKAVWDTRDRAEAAEARADALEAEVRRLRAYPHPIDPVDETADRLGDPVARCGFCDGPVYQTGDWRGDRWRHGKRWRDRQPDPLGASGDPVKLT